MTERKTETRRTGNQDSTPESLAELFTSILGEVQKQVQSKAPEPLEDAALAAVGRFKEIVAALALQARPTIDLIATPREVPVEGGLVALSWSATNALTVLLEQDVGGVITPLGELTPAAGGSRNFQVDQRTVFTATARGLCASSVDSEVVTLAVLP